MQYVGLGRAPPGRRSRRAPRPADDQRSRLSRKPIARRRSAISQPRLLYWHVGDGRFKDMSTTAGPGISAALVVARIGGGRSRQRRLARSGGQQHGGAAQPAEEPRAAAALAAGPARRARRPTATPSARARSCTSGGRRVSGEVQTGSSYPVAERSPHPRRAGRRHALRSRSRWCGPAGGARRSPAAPQIASSRWSRARGRRRQGALTSGLSPKPMRGVQSCMHSERRNPTHVVSLRYPGAHSPAESRRTRTSSFWWLTPFTPRVGPARFERGGRRIAR